MLNGTCTFLCEKKILKEIHIQHNSEKITFDHIRHNILNENYLMHS